MSQRISDLTPVVSLSGDELVEISVPNEASPTGYVTRSANTSLFGGGGGELPYRFTFDIQDESVSSDWTFRLYFSKSEFNSTAFRPNGNSDPDGNWTLATAIMNFNAIAAFRYSEDYYEYSKFAPLNSSVWVNKVGGVLGSGSDYDSDQLRYGSYAGNNDFEIYQIPNSYPSTNYMNNTPVIAPVNVWEEGDMSGDGFVVVQFRVVLPYNGMSPPNAMNIKGYADINMAFSNFYHPA